MATRKPAAKPTPTVSRVERPKPSWYEHRVETMHLTTHSIGTWLELVHEGRIRIPAFQRPWVWTDDQVVRLLNSIMQGYHVGNLLVWRKYSLPPWKGTFGEMQLDVPGHTDCGQNFMVIDGQQRLGALLTAEAAERFKFNISTGRACCTVRNMPDLIPFGLLMSNKGLYRILDGWCKEHAAHHGLDAEELFDVTAHAAAMMSGSYALSAVEIPERWPMDHVIESFKRINTEGTPMDPAQLQAAIERTLAHQEVRHEPSRQTVQVRTAAI